MEKDSALQKATEIFEKLTFKREKYLSVQECESKDAKVLGKLLYDFMKKGEDSPTKNALPTLIIQDFDEEQIWQEIELQNDDKWSGFLSNVSSILSQKKSFDIPVELAQNGDVEMNGDEGSSQEESDEGEEEEQEIETVKIKSKGKNDVQSSSNKKSKSSGKKKGSIVDDKFFKLNEMEEFLDAQDKLEMLSNKSSSKKRKKEEESSDDEDNEESVDLFEEMEDESEDEIKYDDFFDTLQEDSNQGDGLQERDDEETSNDEPSDSDEEKSAQGEEEHSDVELPKKDKKVRFSMPQSSSEDDESSSDETKNQDNMTEFEKRQQRLKKKIGHIESSMLEEKAWPMKGEVSASTRPQNSLLEEVVDFDIASRPAPIITEETTMKLEDIIIQRVKDKAWDDVVRKSKPVQEVQEFKKELVLDQEKSKLSLAQVYEQDYIKQREALDPDADEKPEEVPKEHEEIKLLMTTLFAKLDALTNFHYTPKMVAPEVKIVSNIPAIAMEEVAPVATSDATLLAPEEVKAKSKGDIISKSERTDTDKNRERRQKKLKQRIREKERQKKGKLLDKIRPGLGNKYSREKASKLMDKVTKERNVDKMEAFGDGKSIKSSKAFFTQLQDEVSGKVKSNVSFKKRNKNVLTAKKVKL